MGEVLAVEAYNPLRKDGTPKGKPGRPSNAEKPLGKASLTKMARKLGNHTDEALDFIINYMKDSKNPEKERFRAATMIVGTVQALIQQVDRQTLMQKTLQRLNAKEGGTSTPQYEDAEGHLDMGGDATFSMDMP